MVLLFCIDKLASKLYGLLGSELELHILLLLSTLCGVIANSRGPVNILLRKLVTNRIYIIIVRHDNPKNHSLLLIAEEVDNFESVHPENLMELREVDIDEEV